MACVDCAKDLSILAKGRCRRCYDAEWRKRPGRKEARRKYLALPNIREKTRATQREYVKTPKMLEKRATYKRERHGAQLGFTKHLEHALLHAQFCRCAICHVGMLPDMSKTGIRRDHDHATGAARGILCSACNFALGYYEKQQRLAGLVIEPYERYLANPPAKRNAS